MAAVGMLYAYDVGNESIATKPESYLDERRLKGKYRSFAAELFEGTFSHLESLDEVLSKHLNESWSFDRFGRLERAILRLAAYELIHTETDGPIIINEAIEMAKEMADDDAPKLINGILESLQKATRSAA
jgi:N utilization substance protein B